MSGTGLAGSSKLLLEALARPAPWARRCSGTCRGSEDKHGQHHSIENRRQLPHGSLGHDALQVGLPRLLISKTVRNLRKPATRTESARRCGPGSDHLSWDKRP